MFAYQSALSVGFGFAAAAHPTCARQWSE